jgi:hypothetical protein
MMISRTHTECVLDRAQNKRVESAPAKALEYSGGHALGIAASNIGVPNCTNKHQQQRDQVERPLAVDPRGSEADASGYGRDDQRNAGQGNGRCVGNLEVLGDLGIHSHEYRLRHTSQGNHEQKAPKVEFFSPYRPVLQRFVSYGCYLPRYRLKPTKGSSGSSLGWGTSSTRPYFPCPYLIRLFEAIVVQESRFVDPGNVREAGVRDVWVVAVPGLVGGFIARGACGHSKRARDGGDLFEVAADFVTGLGGSGLFGG